MKRKGAFWTNTHTHTHTRPRQMGTLSFRPHVGMRLLRFSYIGFVTAAYFVLAVIAAETIETLVTGPFDEERAREKSTLRLCVELILHLWVVGIVMYEVRYIVESIPFFEGVFGFRRNEVAATSTGTLFVVMFFAFQRHLGKKLKFVYEERICTHPALLNRSSHRPPPPRRE